MSEKGMAVNDQSYRPLAEKDFLGLRVAAIIDTWIVSGPGRQLAALAISLRAHGIHLRIYMFQRVGRPKAPYILYLEQAGVDHFVICDRGPFDPLFTNL